MRIIKESGSEALKPAASPKNRNLAAKTFGRISFVLRRFIEPLQKRSASVCNDWTPIRSKKVVSLNDVREMLCRLRA